MYKICNGLLPQVIHIILYHIRNKDIHSYNTRGCNLLRVPKWSMNFETINTRLRNVLLLNIDVNVSITTFTHNLKTHIGRGPKSVSHQVVATLLRQLDFCTMVNRNLFANHYLKVPMFLVAHFFPMACQQYFDEAHFSLALRGGRSSLYYPSLPTSGYSLLANQMQQHFQDGSIH